MMSDTNLTYGQQGEAAAATHLRRFGYTILERNYRTSMGEIDIIAEQNGVLVFVEVKARRSQRYGHPKAAITAKKRRTLSMVAQAYLKKHRTGDVRSRFDVVTIQHVDGKPIIEIFPNAFDIAYA